MVDGLLLDFSGVIIDSESADEQAWCEAFGRAGVPLTAHKYTQIWLHWSWHRVLAPLAFLRAWNPRVDAAAVMDRRLARYTQLCASLPARPGIRAWLSQARKEGIRVGLASNDSTGRAPTHLRRLGLDEFFDAVVTLPEGMPRKPAPDLYYLALRTLALTAADTVVIEDSSHGISGAHRAGIRAIAFPTPLSQRTDLGDADLITDPHARTLTEALYRLPATARTQPVAPAAAPWRQARDAASTIMMPALAILPRRPGLITDTVDLLTALCYQWAHTTGHDSGPMPHALLREHLTRPTLQLTGALAGLDHAIPSLRRWRSDPPDTRVIHPSAEVVAAARTALDHLNPPPRVRSQTPRTTP